MGSFNRVLLFRIGPWLGLPQVGVEFSWPGLPWLRLVLMNLFGLCAACLDLGFAWPARDWLDCHGLPWLGLAWHGLVWMSRLCCAWSLPSICCLWTSLAWPCLACYWPAWSGLTSRHGLVHLVCLACLACLCLIWCLLALPRFVWLAVAWPVGSARLALLGFLCIGLFAAVLGLAWPSLAWPGPGLY